MTNDRGSSQRTEDAARHAAKAWPNLAFAVADLWGEWPLHDGSTDIVLNIFAPRNIAEAARVLRPAGWLALVYPGPHHLVELVERFALLQQQPRKEERYLESVRGHIGPCEIVRMTDRVHLDSGAVRDAILMGPNARHVLPLLPNVAPSLDVTFDIAIIFAGKHLG